MGGRTTHSGQEATNKKPPRRPNVFSMAANSTARRKSRHATSRSRILCAVGHLLARLHQHSDRPPASKTEPVLSCAADILAALMLQRPESAGPPAGEPPRLAPRLSREDSGAPTGGKDSDSRGYSGSGDPNSSANRDRSLGGSQAPGSDSRRRARPKQQQTRVLDSKYVRAPFPDSFGPIVPRAAERPKNPRPSVPSPRARPHARRTHAPAGP